MHFFQCAIGRAFARLIVFIISISLILQSLPAWAGEATLFSLPKPGQMVPLSESFSPVVLKGIKLDPKNPFRFHFYVDQGDMSFPNASVGNLNQEQLKTESHRLIKYFLAALTIPEKDLWVNLSPYEKDRIIPEAFGQTEMGRDLLAQDYILKQITASLIYPESQMGKQFWDKVYKEAKEKYGTTEIPINTFNKVWIVPEKAVVYENNGTAYVLENHLKVMLEQDYLATSRHPEPKAKDLNKPKDSSATPQNDVNALGSQIVREIVIPALTKEVNEGKNFAQLRQVFYSLILATWYKKKIKDSILNKIYADKNKVTGVGYKASVILSQAKDLNKLKDSSAMPQNDEIDAIYQQYLKAFKKGVFNYIKEEPTVILSEAKDPNATTIPRKYFSGGVIGAPAIEFISSAMISPAQVAEISHVQLTEVEGRVDLAMIKTEEKGGGANDKAMQVSEALSKYFNSPKNRNIAAYDLNFKQVWVDWYQEGNNNQIRYFEVGGVYFINKIDYDKMKSQRLVPIEGENIIITYDKNIFLSKDFGDMIAILAMIIAYGNYIKNRTVVVSGGEGRVSIIESLVKKMGAKKIIREINVVDWERLRQEDGEIYTWIIAQPYGGIKNVRKDDVAFVYEWRLPFVSEKKVVEIVKGMLQSRGMDTFFSSYFYSGPGNYDGTYDVLLATSNKYEHLLSDAKSLVLFFTDDKGRLHYDPARVMNWAVKGVLAKYKMEGLKILLEYGDKTVDALSINSVVGLGVPSGAHLVIHFPEDLPIKKLLEVREDLRNYLDRTRDFKVLSKSLRTEDQLTGDESAAMSAVSLKVAFQEYRDYDGKVEVNRLNLSEPKEDFVVSTRIEPGRLKNYIREIIRNALDEQETGLIDVRFYCQGTKIIFEVVNNGGDIWSRLREKARLVAEQRRLFRNDQGFLEVSDQPREDHVSMSDVRLNDLLFIKKLMAGEKRGKNGVNGVALSEIYAALKQEGGDIQVVNSGGRTTVSLIFNAERALLRSWNYAPVAEVEKIMTALRYLDINQKDFLLEILQKSIVPLTVFSTSMQWYLNKEFPGELSTIIFDQQGQLRPLVREVLIQASREDATQHGGLRLDTPYTERASPLEIIDELSIPLDLRFERQVREKVIGQIEPLLRGKLKAQQIMVVEGIPGVGKSTVGKYIKQHGLAGINPLKTTWLDLDKYFLPGHITPDGDFVEEGGWIVGSSAGWGGQKFNRRQFTSDLMWAKHEGQELIVVTGYSAASFFMKGVIPKPDMRIVLELSNEMLIHRWEKYGRSFDVNVMRQEYERMSKEWDRFPVAVDLKINMDDVEPVKNAAMNVVSTGAEEMLTVFGAVNQALEGAMRSQGLLDLGPYSTQLEGLMSPAIKTMFYGEAVEVVSEGSEFIRGQYPSMINAVSRGNYDKGRAYPMELLLKATLILLDQWDNVNAKHQQELSVQWHRMKNAYNGVVERYNRQPEPRNEVDEQAQMLFGTLDDHLLLTVCMANIIDDTDLLVRLSINAYQLGDLEWQAKEDVLSVMLMAIHFSGGYSELDRVDFTLMEDTVGGLIHKSKNEGDPLVKRRYERALANLLRSIAESDTVSNRGVAKSLITLMKRELGDDIERILIEQKDEDLRVTYPLGSFGFLYNSVFAALGGTVEVFLNYDSVESQRLVGQFVKKIFPYLDSRMRQWVQRADTVGVPEHITKVYETAIAFYKQWKVGDEAIPVPGTGPVTAAMSVAKGGIDMNPAQMSLQVKNVGQDFHFDFNGVKIDAAQVTGAEFIINDIKPVTNLLMELGLSVVR